MKDELKLKLFDELSTRLPYHPHIAVYSDEHNEWFTAPLYSVEVRDEECNDIWVESNNYGGTLENVRPFLRSLASMTDDEKEELRKVASGTACLVDKEIKIEGMRMYHAYRIGVNANEEDVFAHEALLRVFRWLREHQFDFDSAINYGIAVKVTDDNNPYKQFGEVKVKTVYKENEIR